MTKFMTLLGALMISAAAMAAKVDVAIEGMTCSMCEKSITQYLNATGKCEQVKVSVNDKKATFDIKKGQSITDSEIENAVKAAGYQAVKITRF